MNGIEDLVRQTLAERAHDVDGLTLAAPTPRPRAPWRWVAVGGLVAAAVAIVLAVALVPSWRQDPHGDVAPADMVASPPAGLQWVSYHGITLTVPDTWAVSNAPCAVAPGHPGLVSVDAGPASINCSRMPIADETGPKTTVSLTEVVTTAEPAGDLIHIDGHDAYRTSVPEATGAFPAPSAYGQVVVPDVRVAVSVESDSRRSVDDVLGGIEYTPVDHLGCIDDRPDFAENLPADSPFPADVVSGVVCQYDSGTGRPGSTRLIGSRRLSESELAVLAEQSTVGAMRTGTSDPGGGDRVYRLIRSGEPTCTVTALPYAGTIEWADFTTTTVSGSLIERFLPAVYPS